MNQKKADVAEHPEVVHHVGLHISEPLDPSPNQTGRVALELVIRHHTQRHRNKCHGERKDVVLQVVPRLLQALEVICS